MNKILLIVVLFLSVSADRKDFLELNNRVYGCLIGKNTLTLYIRKDDQIVWKFNPGILPDGEALADCKRWIEHEKRDHENN